MHQRFAYIFLICVGAVRAEWPLAVVTQADGAQLWRQSQAAAVSARSGDLLFSGDRLAGGTVTLLDCRPKPAWGPGVSVVTPAGCAIPLIPRKRPPAPLTFTREARTPTGLWSEASSAARLVESENAARRGPELGIERYSALALDHPEFREIAAERILVLEEELRRRPLPAAPAPPGRTLALLIGISEFENAQVRPLRFAHEDAHAFERFLRSPRGGQVPEDDIVVLTNRQATSAAVEAALESISRRATANDTVLILLATHGAVVENARSQPRGAFLVTYDADPENLAATALPMSVLQRALRQDLAHAGRVLAFIDACRAGTIGTIPDQSKRKILSVMDSLTETEGKLLLFTASRPGEVSFEGRQYGGGHGAFTFFTLEALNGAADLDASGKVTAGEMISYVQQRVAEATVDKQHPREGGTLDTTLAMADLTLPGIDLGSFQKGVVETSARSARTERPVRVVTLRQAVDFEAALREGRLLPDMPGNVFTAFRQLKQSRRLTRDELEAAQTRLVVALEDQHQQVLLRYLRGDEQPPRREDFVRASKTVQAAMQLFGETPALLSRSLFFEGRLAILDRRYSDAQRHLEAGLRLEPGAAHLWNALGTALLEQGDRDGAVRALMAAIDQAPNWIYPRNSLALAHIALGAFDEAEAAFRAAIALAPGAAYLRVNLGYLYQRLGRLPDAEAAYRDAIARQESMPEAWNALGAVHIARRRPVEAESSFRRALSLRKGFPEARENLARLLSGMAGRAQEAVALRRENREQSPGFLPSRIALAEALTGGEQLAEWRAILDGTPDCLPAHIGVARHVLAAGDPASAARQLALVTDNDAGMTLLELRGDVARAQGDRQAAARLFALAESSAWERADRKRLREKRQVVR